MPSDAPQPQVSSRVLTLPNVLSALRLLGVPVFGSVTISRPSMWPPARSGNMNAMPQVLVSASCCSTRRLNSLAAYQTPLTSSRPIIEKQPVPG